MKALDQQTQISRPTEHRNYIVTSGAVLSCENLVVQAAFGVRLEHPCSEAGMAVDTGLKAEVQQS